MVQYGLLLQLARDLDVCACLSPTFPSIDFPYGMHYADMETFSQSFDGNAALSTVFM